MTYGDYFWAGFSGLKEYWTEYYPLVREGVIRCGKPALLYLKAKVVEHPYPIPVLAVSNLTFIYLAKKISAVAIIAIQKLTAGWIPCKQTAPPFGYRVIVAGIGWSVIVAGNYALYKYVELNQPMPITIGVPFLTFACVVIVHRCLHSRKPAVKPVIIEETIKVL